MDIDKMDNEKLIRDFIDAWPRLDAKELSTYFTEDGVYHNMPTAPVTGREHIEVMIAGVIGAWTATKWEVLNLASRGDVVFAERIDRIQTGDSSLELPCTGVFEIENGKIKVWRDYFDLGTYLKGMTANPTS